MDAQGELGPCRKRVKVGSESPHLMPMQESPLRPPDDGLPPLEGHAAADLVKLAGHRILATGSAWIRG